ncbi:MAG: hypothetical protein V8Q79_09965 [Christensenellales bacterium]
MNLTLEVFGLNLERLLRSAGSRGFPCAVSGGWTGGASGLFCPFGS